MQPIRTYLQEHRPEHLKWAIDLCRIPSISTRPECKKDVAAAAQWVCDLCNRIGLKASVHPTAGHPIVYAEHCQAAASPAGVR